MLRQNDLRHLDRKWVAPLARQQIVTDVNDPWGDANLWPRPRFMGGEMGMGVLRADAGTCAQHDAPAQTFGGQSMKKLTGTTRDSAGSPLGNAVVAIYLTAGDVWLRDCTSDLAGYYEAFSQFSGQNHYLLAYKAGAPDVAGTTVTTLVPT